MRPCGWVGLDNDRVTVRALVAVVVFPEHDASGAVRTGGYIHWAAAMLTFGGLSVAPALLGRHGVSAVCSRLTSLARRMSAGTGPCFVLVAAADLLQYRTPLSAPAWWFGVGERVLVALELAMAAVLIAWAWRGCACGSATRSRSPYSRPYTGRANGHPDIPDRLSFDGRV